jgi:hypothetical protein
MLACTLKLVSPLAEPLSDHAKEAAERRERALKLAFETTVTLSRLAWDNVDADDLRVHRALAELRSANRAAGFADDTERRRHDYALIRRERNEGRDVLPVPRWEDE